MCNEDSCLVEYDVVHIVSNFSEESSSGLPRLGRPCASVLGLYIYMYSNLDDFVSQKTGNFVYITV